MILKSPEKAELSKFKNGDFISVMVGDAIDRLTKACNESFSLDEKKCFEQLRGHRNRVVHFYHDAYSGKPNQKLLEEIAAEQSKAWCYLHRRLKGGWSQLFKKHRDAIERIDKALHQHRVFLQAKYETLKPEIEKEIAAGSEFRPCLACGCLAEHTHEVQTPVYELDCRVCGRHESFVRIACPTCSTMSDIDDTASGICENEECGNAIDLEYIMKQYVPRHDPRDGDREQAYYCAACENTEQSATILGDNFFCFSCKEWFDTIDQCNYCGEDLVGFDSDESSYAGCFVCEEAAWEHFHKD